MQYQEYLKSDHWKDLRNKKTNTRCAICASPVKLETHHLIYKQLFDVRTSDLRKLCRRCHYLTHQLFKEGKIKFRSANHNSRFTIVKTAVKKELGLTKVNLFALAKQGLGSFAD